MMKNKLIILAVIFFSYHLFHNVLTSWSLTIQGTWEVCGLSVVGFMKLGRTVLSEQTMVQGTVVRWEKRI